MTTMNASATDKTMVNETINDVSESTAILQRTCFRQGYSMWLKTWKPTICQIFRITGTETDSVIKKGADDIDNRSD